MYGVTQGFAVFTTESARRLSVQNQPIVLSDANLTDSANNKNDLLDRLKSDGRVAIVNFIYTRCPYVCVTMGLEFQELQQLITDREVQDKVRLVSISFDPRDTPDWLQRYQKRMGSNTNVWQTWLAAEADQRTNLLNDFGIVVIPAPLGQYEHNTAYHIVTPQGELVRIVDIGEPEQALQLALWYQDGGGNE